MDHPFEKAATSARKAWLKKLASESKDAWMTAVRPAAMDGSTRVETRRSVYRFEDGICMGISRRDGADDDAPEASTRLLGMRLVGWMAREGRDQIVSPTWLPGARAILWRPAGPTDGEAVIAVTSPAFAFVRAASAEVAPPISERRARSVVPQYVVPAPPSRTRIGISA